MAWGIMMYQGGFEKSKQFLEHLYAVTSKGGKVCLNFRTFDNWFYGKEEELEEGYYFLDERTGPYEGSSHAFFYEGGTSMVSIHQILESGSATVAPGIKSCLSIGMNTFFRYFL